MTGVRFGHVNVIASDWRRLAAFYTEVFGCEFVPPERDISGPVLESATGHPGAHLRGAHLRLPGLGPDGPTIEIYEYDDHLPHPAPSVPRPGWNHVAFHVSDVEAMLDAFAAAGGARVGEVVTTPTSDGRKVTWCYATDPEGNLVELQRWSEAE